MRTTLCNWGFSNTKGDSSSFFKGTKTIVFVLLIYVDDILVTGSSVNELQQFTKKLNLMFSLKDLDSLHYFLGFKITRDETGLFMSQKKYIQDVLVKFNMANASSSPTPMVTGRQFLTNDSDSMENPTLYRQLLGALQYATNTKLDITVTVNSLSRFIQKPTVQQWRAVNRVLRYSKGTLDFALHLKPFSEIHVTGFCDVDWAVSLEDRKSVGGFCVYLGDSLVSWSSKRQNAVSRSSTELEYRAIADVAAEILWLKSLMREIGCCIKRIPVIWSDNMGAGSLTVNPILHSPMKHVEIDMHFIRDKVAGRELRVCYVPSSEQVADCLTKALTLSKFSPFRSKLGVVMLPPSSRGPVKELPSRI